MDKLKKFPFKGCGIVKKKSFNERPKECLTKNRLSYKDYTAMCVKLYKIFREKVFLFLVSLTDILYNKNYLNSWF